MITFRRFSQPAILGLILILTGLTLYPTQALGAPPPPQLIDQALHFASFEEGELLNGFSVQREPIFLGFGHRTFKVNTNISNQEIDEIFTKTAEDQEKELNSGTYKHTYSEWTYTTRNPETKLEKLSDDPNKLKYYLETKRSKEREEVKKWLQKSLVNLSLWIVVLGGGLAALITPWIYWKKKRKESPRKSKAVLISSIVLQFLLAFIISYIIYQELYPYVSPPLPKPFWLKYLQGLSMVLTAGITVQLIALYPWLYMRYRRVKNKTLTVALGLIFNLLVSQLIPFILLFWNVF